MNARTALWTLAAAITAVAIFATAWFLASNRDDDQKATPPATQSARPTTSSGAPSPTSTGSTSPSGAANGCLGGEDPQTAVLAAQDAPNTPEGAAAFAASLARFMGYAPRSDTAQDMNTVKRVYAPTLASQTARAGYVAKLPSSQIIRAWSDTKEGNYRVVSATADRVVLDYWVTGHFQAQNGEQADRVVGYRNELRHVGGKWILSRGLGSPPDYDAVVKNNFQGTVRYAGGC